MDRTTTSRLSPLLCGLALTALVLSGPRPAHAAAGTEFCYVQYPDSNRAVVGTYVGYLRGTQANPVRITTEDGFNASAGPNQGFQTLVGQPYTTWLLQFDALNANDGQNYGVDIWTGDLTGYAQIRDVVPSQFSTCGDNGDPATTPGRGNTLIGAVPADRPSQIPGGVSYTWSPANNRATLTWLPADRAGRYAIYRSLNPCGAASDVCAGQSSNGIYQLVATVIPTPSVTPSYSTAIAAGSSNNWFMVMPVATPANTPVFGPHPEEIRVYGLVASPTPTPSNTPTPTPSPTNTPVDTPTPTPTPTCPPCVTTNAATLSVGWSLFGFNALTPQFSDAAGLVTHAAAQGVVIQAVARIENGHYRVYVPGISVTNFPLSATEGLFLAVGAGQKTLTYQTNACP